MTRRDGAAVLGFGVAACAVCCAAPIPAFLAAIGLGTAVGVAAFGAIGLIVALLAVPLLLGRRRRRPRCPAPTDTVRVEAPSVRAG